MKDKILDKRYLLIIPFLMFAIILWISFYQSPPPVKPKPTDGYSLQNLMVRNPSYKVFFDGFTISKYQSPVNNIKIVGLSLNGELKPKHEVHLVPNQHPVEIGNSGIFVSHRLVYKTSELSFYGEGRKKMFGNTTLDSILLIVIVSLIVSFVTRLLTRKSFFGWLKGFVKGIIDDWKDA